MDAHGGPQGHGGQALPQPHRTLAQYGPCNIQLGIPSLWEPHMGRAKFSAEWVLNGPLPAAPLAKRGLWYLS